MRRAMRALTGLAAACALTACGLDAGTRSTPSGAAAPKPRMDAAARYGVLDATAICPETCTHLIGNGSFGDDAFTFYFEIVDSDRGDRGIFAIVASNGAQFPDTTPTVTIDRTVTPAIIRITAEVIDGAGSTVPIELVFGDGAPRLFIGGEQRQLTGSQLTGTDGRCDIAG